jgi:nucleotide-binding universal stress UspA family protein
MKTIDRILFPTDFSTTAQNAMRYTIWVASRYGAEIDVLHVVYPEHVQMDLPAYSAQATAEKVDSAKEVVKVFIDNALVQAQATMNLQHLPEIHSEVHVGGVVNVVMQLARRHESDLIIMGTTGEHSTLQKLFGSVTTAVIGKSPVEVLLIPPDAQPGNMRKVGYAADLSETDPLHIWECIKLLDLFKPAYSVVHIQSPKGEETELKMTELKQFFAEKKLSEKMTFQEIVGDDVDEELTAYIKAHHIDLLVMHTHRRNLFERLLNASHTRKMARHLTVPMLVMKS